MKNDKKAVWNAAYYIFVFLLVLVAALIVVNKMYNRVSWIGKHTVMWILTDSMEDTIPAQSYILVKKADVSKIEEEDVIVFYSDDPELCGNLNTHRVKEINPDGSFVTKGDHNPIYDQYPAAPDKVVGVYVRNLPFLTMLGRAVLTKSGILILFLVIALITAAFYIPGVIRKYRKRGKVEETPVSEYDAEIARRIAEEVEKLKQQNSDIKQEPPPQNQQK